MKRRILALSVVLGACGAIAWLAGPIDWHLTITRGNQPPVTASFHQGPATAAAQTAEDGVETLRSQSKAFVSIAKKVLPSVVSITSERTVQVTGLPRGNGLRFFGDPRLERFFEMPDRAPQQGSGSGVIVRADGYILTKNIKSGPRLAGIPVVMHSSLSSEANRSMGKSVGVDAYVAKFDAEALADTLRPLLLKSQRD